MRQRNLSFSDTLYWIWRNGSATVLCILIGPFWLLQTQAMNIWEGVVATFEANGSTIINYPWEWNWKWNYDEDDDESV